MRYLNNLFKKHRFRERLWLRVSALRYAFVLYLIVTLCACEREKRDFEQPPTRTVTGTTTDFVAGAGVLQPSGNPAEHNAPSLSEGKTLFAIYNCSGCHANGGGGMGPPLMDDEWIYGYYPDQIFRTILEGRPNGMPAFRGRIPDYQVWSIAAYVRSMGGLVPKDAAPPRDDHLSGKKPESSTDKMKPVNSTAPAVQ
jgi:cytochrome c oxidase cbb3-type subunit III